MEREKPESKYGQWIIGMMLVAYLATSFDYRYFSFRSPLLTVGTHKIQESQLVQRIREERAYAKLTLYGTGNQGSDDAYWIGKVARDEIWNQEVSAMGIAVSENRARQSLRQKMCFLDESGSLNAGRLMNFYKKNPVFFQVDFQSTEENGGFVMGDHGQTKLFRGDPDFLDLEDRFDEAKMGAFLRRNGVSLLQMVAAEQRLLGRMVLKTALLKQVFLPSFYKDLAKKGQGQVRSWRSKLFPLDAADDANQRVSKESVDLFLRENPSERMRKYPEMRTFTVMSTPNFATLPPNTKKNGVSESQTMIEDALGAGKKLEDVAKDQGRTYSILTSSATGQALDFSPIAWKQPNGETLKLPKEVREKILDRVFSSQEGVFTLPVMMGGMVWVQVHTISPPRALSEAELYAATEYALKVKKSHAVVEAKAQAFAKNLTAKGMGKSMTLHRASAADALGQKNLGDGMSLHAIMEAFQMTPPPRTCVIKTNDGYEVIELVSVTSEKSQGGEEVRSNDANAEGALDRNWRVAFFQAYTNILERKHKIVPNNEALQAKFGSGSSDQESDPSGESDDE
jgi:hypothetical protein